MKENEILKNLNLSFYWEVGKTKFTSPIGGYFKDFPWENYDLDLISKSHEDLKLLFDRLDRYFKDHAIEKFEFLDNVIYGSYDNPGICIDRERKDLFRKGFIPICLWFHDVNTV